MLKKICAPFVAVLDCITKYFKTFVFLFIVVLCIIGLNEPTQTPNLAKIYIKGAILDSSNLRAQIEEIKKYPSIKGILLIIDSPGGAVGASVEMSDLIKELNESIPVVVHVEGIMASGSYYAGINASKIIANRGSLIGSIGVIFSGVNIQELMEKIGIKPQTLAVGEYKEAGSIYREWTPKEKQYLQEILDESYTIFVQDVAKARKLKTSDSKIFAEGKIFNAPKAKELGLIDTIGSRNEAIITLKELAQVSDEQWLTKSKFEGYMDTLLESSASLIVGKLSGELR